MVQWYTTKTGGDQGLVIDEKTGENVAVTYDKENAHLIAAAPDLLEACEHMVRSLRESAPKQLNTRAGEVVLDAIAKARGDM